MAVRKMQSQRADRTALLDLEQPGGFAPEDDTALQDEAAASSSARDHGPSRPPDAAPIRRRRRNARRFTFDSRWSRIAAGVICAVVAAALAFAFVQVRAWLMRSPRFRVGPVSSIAVTGNRTVPARSIQNLFSADAGRSVFRVPLAERRAQIEAFPWVQEAAVMRLWPNQLRVHVTERTPVAFVRQGDTIQLIDAHGVLLGLPGAAAQHYSFPVLLGIADSDPLSMRVARVGLYRQFAAALDAQGGHIASRLDQVDVSDPEDIRATFMGAGRQPVVHFGSSHFLARYQAYQAHLADWLRQYPQLRSVDLRYGRDVVLDTGAASGAADAASAGAKPAAPAASVKPPVVHTAPPQRHASSGAHSGSARPSQKRSHTHAGGARRKRAHTPAHPERGHRVLHPLMHVVSGV
jgi:cell division protein FtsQ